MKKHQGYNVIICIFIISFATNAAVAQWTPPQHLANDISRRDAASKAKTYLRAFGSPTPAQLPISMEFIADYSGRYWRVNYQEYHLQINSPNGALRQFRDLKKEEAIRRVAPYKGLFTITSEAAARAKLIKVARIGGVPQEKLNLKSFSMGKDNEARTIFGHFLQKTPGGYPLHNHDDGAVVGIDRVDGNVISFYQQWKIKYLPANVTLTRQEILQIAKRSPNYSRFLEVGKRHLQHSPKRPNSPNQKKAETVTATLHYAVLNLHGKLQSHTIRLPLPANLVWVVEYGYCHIYFDPLTGKELESQIFLLQ